VNQTSATTVTGATLELQPLAHVNRTTTMHVCGAWEDGWRDL